MRGWMRWVRARGAYTGWVLLAAGALASCGGGGDNPAAGPAPVAAPTQPLQASTGPARIEPYERVTTQAQRRASPTQALSVVPPTVAIQLGAEPPQFVQAKAAAIERPPQAAIARQIGAARSVAALATPADTARALAWQPTAAGGLAASASFRSDGAAGLRLGLQVERLPASAQVRVRPAGSMAADTVLGEEILATLARNRASGDVSHDGRTYWLPAVAGDTLTLEIELPAGTDPAQVQVAVPRLSHLWWTHEAVARANELKFGEAGACNADATCSPEYAFESRAIARMEYVRGGSAFLCTGTLMADTLASGTPYFLGANHCVDDQTTASTLSTYWFYRSAACNSNTLDPAATRVTGGATLLHVSATTDTSFMVLRGSPPAGAVHAGSLLSAPALGTALAGLHHPAGDLLKLSLGTNPAYARCEGTRCTGDDLDASNFLVLRWTRGTTESGSSGSPVFAGVGARRYVVGQLFAGSASCTRPDANDYYGRFDKAYSVLRTWLGIPGG